MDHISNFNSVAFYCVFPGQHLHCLRSSYPICNTCCIFHLIRLSLALLSMS